MYPASEMVIRHSCQRVFTQRHISAGDDGDLSEIILFAFYWGPLLSTLSNLKGFHYERGLQYLLLSWLTSPS